MSFVHELADLPISSLRQTAEEADATRVEGVLSSGGQIRLDDFAALLAPAAGERLEEMARASREVTLTRFGRTMRLYAPLYLSNECLTSCTYCGFAKDLPIARKTLTVEQTLEEARHLVRAGFRSILLLTGEHERLTGVDFLVEHIEALAAEVPQIGIEVQVWTQEEYEQLAAAGCDGVTIYQETYDRDTYAQVHVAGRKRRYDFRLEGPDRAAAAGMRRLGIGALFGLHDDWRSEAIAVAAHAAYLQRMAWGSAITVSVPRMRPSASGYQPRTLLSDRELTQLVCALRLFLPDVGIVLSTREPAPVRDGLFQIGVTHVSAGSHTEPGGYEHPDEATEQFEIADRRSPAQVSTRLRELGYDPVWEDFSSVNRGVERHLVSGA